MKSSLSKYLVWLALPLLLLLASCGFHLRNMLTVPANLRLIYINAPMSNTYNSFIQTFTPLSAVNHLHITNSRAQAQAIINIINIYQPAPQMTSMTGSDQAGQYTLYYEITFNIENPQGRVLVPVTTMQQSRSFNSNASQILSANSQAQRLTVDMQQTLANSILNQLASVRNSNS